MGKLKEKLTDYKNFWLIWLSCAGQKEGISLFSIQNTWSIKTNYLYHNEAGLGKPLFRLMKDRGFIRISNKKILPEFGWIPEYIIGRLRKDKPVGGFWSPELTLKSKWVPVQIFMEKYRKYFFDLQNLRVLYRNDKDVMGTYGRYIFMHVFLYVLFSNLVAFSKRYHADVVSRMMSTAISIATGADLLNYMYSLHSQIGGSPEFPVLVSNDEELSKLLCGLRW